MSVILYGPQGCGKTIHAPRIAAYFKLERIVDESEQGVSPGSVYLLPLAGLQRFAAGRKLYLTCEEPPPDLLGSSRVVSIAMALHCTLSYEMRDLSSFTRAVSLAVDGLLRAFPRVDQASTGLVLQRLGIAPRLQTASMTSMTRQALLALGWTRHSHQRSGSLQHVYVRPITH